MAAGGPESVKMARPTALLRMVKRVGPTGCAPPPPRLPPLGGGDLEGVQMVSIEPAAMFPVVHFINNCRKNYPDIQDDDILEEQAIGVDFVIYQAFYHEIRNIKPEWEIPAGSKYIYYMLLGFKTLDYSYSQVLEDSWREWTSARYIYLNLPDDLGLSQISLYKQKFPWCISIFSYVVLAEFHNITNENQALLFDFAQRLRTERITGYISVYSCERHMLHPKDLRRHQVTTAVMNGFSNCDKAHVQYRCGPL